jgi:ribosome-associated protein
MMKTREKALRGLQLAEEKKAKEPIVLELMGLSDIADFFVIASGTSERHVKTVAENVELGMKKRGVTPFSSEGYDEGRWVIIDYGDVIVHVFLEQLRELYDLESLWIEGKRYRPDEENKILGVENEPGEA